jgi:hypothetical protein
VRMKRMTLVGRTIERWLHQPDHGVLELPRLVTRAPGEGEVLELPYAQTCVVVPVEVTSSQWPAG